MEEIGDRPQEGGDHVETSRRPEHADGDQNGHDVGQDAQADLEAFLATLDEFIVDRNAPQGGVERKEDDQPRQRENGDGIDQPV